MVEVTSSDWSLATAITLLFVHVSRIIHGPLPSIIVVTSLLALQFSVVLFGSEAADSTVVSCLPDRFFFGQDVILATTRDNELFQATNEGWKHLVPPSGWTEIKVVTPDTFYVLVADERSIYQSSDGGDSWHLVGLLPIGIDGAEDTDLYPSPVSELLFLSVASPTGLGGGIWKSSDNGASWTPVLGDLRFDYGGAVTFSPDFIHDGIAFTVLSTSHITTGVWKTTDWGVLGIL